MSQNRDVLNLIVRHNSRSWFWSAAAVNIACASIYLNFTPLLLLKNLCLERFCYWHRIRLHLCSFSNVMEKARSWRFVGNWLAHVKRPLSKDSHTWFMPVYRRLCCVTAAHVSLLMCFEVACTQHSHTFEVQFREVFLWLLVLSFYYCFYMCITLCYLRCRLAVTHCRTIANSCQVEQIAWLRLAYQVLHASCSLNLSSLNRWFSLYNWFRPCQLDELVQIQSARDFDEAWMVWYWGHCCASMKLC